MSAPLPGSLPYVRAWQGDAFRRGAVVSVNGERGHITQAEGARVAVRLWDSNRRVVVLPHEIEFAEPEFALA